MMRRCFLIGCLALAASVHAQDLRLESLGSMRYALDDPRTSPSIYRFGQNPAWMLREEEASWLTFTPQIGNTWGEYRRVFDPGHVSSYGAGFEGVKPLGSRGTFRGFASYGIEERSSVYRSLKRTPYGGEAYYLADTTTGSFTYQGPSVAFAYAYEMVPGLIVGAELDYALQDGLKDLPTNAKTLFRTIHGVAGIAYDAGDGLALGATIRPFDDQERINCDREDLLEVEVFRYRGESVARLRRDSEIDQTVRRTGEEYSAQAAWRPAEGLHIGVYGLAGLSRTRDLVEISDEIEFEDGFSQRTWYEAAARARLLVGPQMSIGCGVSHRHQREWSKYPAMGLLVWDARGTETVLGLGAAFALGGGSHVAVEGEYAVVHTDSSKYIDNRFAMVRTGEFRVRTGAEVPISGVGILRASYSFGSVGLDVRTGGRDVTEHGVTAGLAIPLGPLVRVEWLTRYGHRSSGTAVVRDDVSAILLLRLAEL